MEKMNVSYKAIADRWVGGNVYDSRTLVRSVDNVICRSPVIVVPLKPVTMPVRSYTTRRIRGEHIRDYIIWFHYYSSWTRYFTHNITAHLDLGKVSNR